MKPDPMILLAAFAALLCGAQGRADSAPTPPSAATASPSPSPAMSLHAVVSETFAVTNGVNATGSLDSPTGVDRAARSNVSNAFVILTKSAGVLQYGLQAGAYSIPTVGFAGNKTIQSGANTDLYGPLPLAYVAYAPSANFNVSAGILATLIGAESTFTYQDWNIQRGAVWNVENAVSRGVRASWNSGKFTATLGLNDGFYSAHYGAAEASLTFAPDPSDSALFVALIPNSRTPGNPSAAIANKQLLNLVFTRTRGNLQIAPYVLFTRSPAAPNLMYTRSETAFGAALLANLSISTHFSVAARWETLHNASVISDTSANADLVGYGPGSGVDTFTLTPEWKSGETFARADLSAAHVTGAAPGLAFSAAGNRLDQFRTVFEAGVQI